MKNLRFYFSVFVMSGFIFLCVFSGVNAQERDTRILEHRTGLPTEMLITADQLRGKQIKNENFVLFDARSHENYQRSHIPGAILPFPEEYYRQKDLFRQRLASAPPDMDAALAETMRRYPKDTPVVAYCEPGCQASASLIMKIKQLGFRNVRDMEEGLYGWEKKGYPVSK